MKKPTRAGKTTKASAPRGDARSVSHMEIPAPSADEARRRIRSKPGFFESLTPEARTAISEYDGAEVIGSPERS